MIALDTSAWLEILNAGPRHRAFRQFLEAADSVLVPTIVMYEIFKVAKRERGDLKAKTAVGQLKMHQVVPLTEVLALEAANHSLEHQLPMADAIIYAAAQAHGATLVTGDAHFMGLPSVEYVPLPD